MKVCISGGWTGELCNGSGHFGVNVGMQDV